MGCNRDGVQSVGTVNDCSQCYRQMDCCKAEKITVDTIRNKGIHYACYFFLRKRLNFSDADKAELDVAEVIKCMI
jgi:hypothetical protein